MTQPRRIIVEIAQITCSLLLLGTAILVDARPPLAYGEMEELRTTNGQIIQEPSGVLTLADACGHALLRSPELSVFSWEIRARQAAAIQAGLVPNPELQAEIEDFAGSDDKGGFDAAQTTIRLAQLIELAGKRGKRQDISERAKEVASYEFDAARFDVLGATAKAFIEALLIQERLTLTDELLRTSRMSVQVANAQVKAGAATEVELLRTEVAVGQLEASRQRLEQELRAAYSTLASRWGSNTVEFTNVTGDLYSTDAPPPLDALTSRVIETPFVRRWDAERSEKEAALSLERAKAIPDLTLGLGGRHFSVDDADALVAEISFPLPLFNRNQGGIQEASFRLKKVEAERTRAVLALTTELRAAHAAMSGAFAEISRLRQTVVPKAETALSGARESYERGVFRALDVLDAQRTVFSVQEQHLEGLAAYHRARTEVDRLTGLLKSDLFSGSK